MNEGGYKNRKPRREGGSKQKKEAACLSVETFDWL